MYVQYLLQTRDLFFGSLLCKWFVMFYLKCNFLQMFWKSTQNSTTCMANIYPLTLESNDSLESDDESGLSDTGANENLDDSDFVAELSWRPSTVNAPLGEWEAHTKVS